VIDAGEHVVVIAHRWGRNEVTGLQISDKIAQVFSFDDDDHMRAASLAKLQIRLPG